LTRKLSVSLCVFSKAASVDDLGYAFD
jgi:hypothetical protein